ncbi:MAG: sporulation protein [Alicyclobacillus sp. RIFOXYA1_FULL_53_8]|nr:MAG: sporulation protein [Alicyclobacillus sp. RIFOXYA1_FULL_53_8]
MPWTNKVFVNNLVLDFFVSMGMVIGGALLGGLGAVLRHSPPMATMLNLADQLKVWALVSTLGGTMDTLRMIETGVLGGQVFPMAKQLAYLLAAFVGSQLGFWLIRSLAGSDRP